MGDRPAASAGADPADPAGLAAEAAAVRAFWSALGLSGLHDVHTHFLPPRVMAKVRAQFDAGGELIGRPWPLHYRDTDEALVGVLESFGVRSFTALPYAHRPEMAAWLTDWAVDFAARTPGARACGTFYPEPDAAAGVAERLDEVEVWKIHVQVGGFDVRDPLLDQAWALIAEAGTPVVLHAGSGPVGTAYTGPEPVADLLARHPRLCLVIAHAGAPEYDEFATLAETHERVLLDTTMAFTDFFTEMGAPPPPDLPARLLDLGLAGKVLHGSDFPNIPYPYAHQLEALARLDLGEEWLRAVCWHNAEALLGPAA